MNADPRPCLFAPAASRAWAQDVAAALGTALQPLEEREFEDGEHKGRPGVEVRGRDVYVLYSLHGDAQHSAGDKLCRLLFLIGALKDAAAARVTAVVPYLAFARKDRRTQPQDPVTTRYVAALFEAVGVDRVMTLDVHNLAAFENAFRCPTEHLEASGLFVDFFAPRLAGREVVVVAPDAGGLKRAEAFRKRLEAALARPVGAAFAEKHRSLGAVSGELLAGDVDGRCAIVIDDLVSTGGTLARTARNCLGHGAAEVWAAASHGLFTGDAAQVLGDGSLAGLVVTDVVPPWRLAPGPARDRLQLLPTAALFAQAIERIHGEFASFSPAARAQGMRPGASAPGPNSGGSAAAS